MKHIDSWSSKCLNRVVYPSFGKIVFEAHRTEQRVLNILHHLASRSSEHHVLIVHRPDIFGWFNNVFGYFRSYLKSLKNGD